jgi:hypothetical protein
MMKPTGPQTLPQSIIKYYTCFARNCNKFQKQLAEVWIYVFTSWAYLWSGAEPRIVGNTGFETWAVRRSASRHTDYANPAVSE